MPYCNLCGTAVDTVDGLFGWMLLMVCYECYSEQPPITYISSTEPIKFKDKDA